MIHDKYDVAAEKGRAILDREAEYLKQEEK